MTPGPPDRLEGYEPFFGLHEAPFSLAPDPRFLFASASHSAALAQVAYALERREPLVVITGEIGTGKTLLCRTVLQQLRRKTFLSVIDDPLLERDDLLKQLLEDFGVISKDRTRLTETTRHELIETLQAFLRSLAPLQAHAVVIVDEAQHLRPDVLEQIRLLSNTDDEHGTLLQIILVGQSDLEPLLALPELSQLQQRVSRRIRLEPLNRDEVKQYIKHRLTLARDGKAATQLPGATELARELAEWAGTNDGVDFTPDAIQTVSQLSHGLPRVINLLCDRSLEEAHASRLRIVDRPLVLTAAQVLGIGETGAPASPGAAARGTQPVPDETFWADSRTFSEADDAILQTADDAPGVVLGAHTAPAAPSQLPKYLVLATALVLAAVAIWFAVRQTQPAPAVTSAPPAAAATPRPPAAPPEPPPIAAPPAGAATPPPAAAPAATAGVDNLPAKRPEVAQLRDPRFEPSTPAATSAGDRFEVLIASFKTESRASSVAAEVTALGLPMRRRVVDSWQQVVSGPFASRAEAEAAQARLHRAGLTGTQIISASR